MCPLLLVRKTIGKRKKATQKIELVEAEAKNNQKVNLKSCFCCYKCFINGKQAGRKQ